MMNPIAPTCVGIGVFERRLEVAMCPARGAFSIPSQVNMAEECRQLANKDLYRPAVKGYVVHRQKRNMFARAQPD